MDHERRRFFRIDESVGVSWQIIDNSEKALLSNRIDFLSLVAEQDQRIEHLLFEIQEENPKVAEIVRLFNQKLERVLSQIMVDNSLVTRIASRIKEANLSACGIGFSNDEPIPVGANLRLEITLYPTQKRITTDGRVVGCDQADTEGYYWRIDFMGMSKADQEELIQHIVRSQSQQLKTRQY